MVSRRRVIRSGRTQPDLVGRLDEVSTLANRGIDGAQLDQVAPRGASSSPKGRRADRLEGGRVQEQPEGPIAQRAHTQRGHRAAVIGPVLLILGSALGLLVTVSPVDGPVSAQSPRQAPGKPKTAMTTSLLAPHDALGRSSVQGRDHLDDDDDLPPDCVPDATGPPSAPYELGLVGQLSGGTLTSSATTVSDIAAKFCALVTLVNSSPPCAATGDVDSPVDGQVFGPMSVLLTLVPDMSPTIGFTAQPGVITGGFTCQPSTNGLAVTLNASVGGSTSPIFGVSCAIGPVQIPLTGAVTGPLTDTTATLKSNDFVIPALQPSATCPSAVATQVDAIAGLPLAVGSSTANLPVTASLYQPVP
jgi:hypothetical protein